MSKGVVFFMALMAAVVFAAMCSDEMGGAKTPPGDGVYYPDDPRWVLVCAESAHVHGSAREDSIIMRMAARGERVQRRERYEGFTMIEQARWINDDDLCGGER